MIRILLSRRLGELRWTQTRLANATGINKNTISLLYNDMADRVSLEQLDYICEALDCDLSDILVYEKSPIPRVREIAVFPAGRRGKK